jgi:hypothetical protein
MTDVMPLGGDLSYQDVDMDIDLGYLEMDTTESNIYPTVRIQARTVHDGDSNH